MLGGLLAEVRGDAGALALEAVVDPPELAVPRRLARAEAANGLPASSDSRTWAARLQPPSPNGDWEEGLGAVAGLGAGVAAVARSEATSCLSEASSFCWLQRLLSFEESALGFP